ncbi:hypothetical protein K2X33_02725 [bacterium]|nr:hypothetical protein [bacterium]
MGREKDHTDVFVLCFVGSSDSMRFGGKSKDEDFHRLPEVLNSGMKWPTLNQGTQVVFQVADFGQRSWKRFFTARDTDAFAELTRRLGAEKGIAFNMSTWNSHDGGGSYWGRRFFDVLDWSLINPTMGLPQVVSDVATQGYPVTPAAVVYEPSTGDFWNVPIEE